MFIPIILKELGNSNRPVLVTRRLAKLSANNTISDPNPVIIDVLPVPKVTPAPIVTVSPFLSPKVAIPNILLLETADIIPVFVKRNRSFIFKYSEFTEPLILALPTTTNSEFATVVPIPIAVLLTIVCGALVPTRGWPPTVLPS